MAAAVLIVEVLTISIPMMYCFMGGEAKPWLVSMLWALSSVMTCAGAWYLLWIHQKRPILTAVVGGFDSLKNLLLIVYMRAAKGTITPKALTISAWISLLLATILVFLTFRLMSGIMKYMSPKGDVDPKGGGAADKSNNSAWSDIIHQLLAHRFLSAGGLMVFFWKSLCFGPSRSPCHDLACSRQTLRRVIPKLVDNEQPVDNRNQSSASTQADDEKRQVYLLSFTKGASKPAM